MNIKQLLLLGLTAIAFVSQAQRTGLIRGVIKDSGGSPIPSISIKLTGFTKATTSNQRGEYHFLNVKPGNYTLIFSGVGFKTTEKKVEVKEGKESIADIELTDNTIELNTVTVVGRTEVQEVNRQSFNVTACRCQAACITLPLTSAVRWTGFRAFGLANRAELAPILTFRFNGFSGNRIRYFIDGVPMDNFRVVLSNQ
jgi:hypothetical protein